MSAGARAVSQMLREAFARHGYDVSQNGGVDTDEPSYKHLCCLDDSGIVICPDVKFVSFFIELRIAIARVN